MVRFIMPAIIDVIIVITSFTFQYGQIYYDFLEDYAEEIEYIYIPIWLDLLYQQDLNRQIMERDLHSNMVRFIIQKKRPHYHMILLFTFQYGQIYYILLAYSFRDQSKIYIPIWLDLLYITTSMEKRLFNRFTFQYGQIYYFINVTN